MLEFGLLGPLEVRDGERVLVIRRRKQRALLAALALEAGRAISTDRLVEELWGEHSPRTAKHALENYVSELRKTLGREVIGTGPGGYVLEIDRDQVDVSRFERLVTEARGGEAEERAERLRAALALFRGPPLTDLAFEPFAQRAVARLEELELAAREELVDAELELGRHNDVVAELEAIVAAHPYRERPRAQLMLALYRSGRQADALFAYQEARRALVDELGIDPGEELQELERAILRQDPSLRAPRREPGPRPAPSAAATTRGPARKTVTIALAELANRASLAGALDPEPLRLVLDRYLAAARSSVERHGGLSERMTAESALAVFGVPAAHEDDALRAVRAAHDLRDAIGVLNDGLLPEHGLFLEVRIAVTTGEVLVTPDGQDLVTGQAVVSAEALERTGRAGQILLDARTHTLVRDAVGAHEIETGVEGLERAYRLVELTPDAHGRLLRLDSPLVGRRRQLAALASAFENSVAEGSLHLFTLVGAAGVGKSRLVREFTDGVDGVATVLEGRCLPYGEAITYWPLVEALSQATGDEAELDDEPGAHVRSMLERLALERPLVVVLDDFQWAEPALLDVVEHVAETSRSAPILVVCVARPELFDGRPSWSGGKPNTSSLLLEPLNDVESDRLVDNLLGESDLPESVRDHIIRTADGNPLFVEELLATLVESDVLRREAGRWTTTTAAAIPLPVTIQALIEARIDRLPDDERVVLELASMGGRNGFERSAVVELAPETLRARIDPCLAGLVRKELVRPLAGEEYRYSFRHDLIRDAAYASLPIQVRADLHERLATFIELEGARDTELLELVSYHRGQARKHRTVLGGS